MIKKLQILHCDKILITVLFLIIVKTNCTQYNEITK